MANERETSARQMAPAVALSGAGAAAGAGGGGRPRRCPFQLKNRFTKIIYSKLCFPLADSAEGRYDCDVEGINSGRNIAFPI
ncbi:hypothetical protein EVAR_13155_1 [Eumeta japonica]|uniref:Uncharacterized protein n=1 Tax=Eumeta variegata TaxID=151549 RepID=A0A4C1UB41_EUMVA|nr:hypothetical protein EVAR_13155_1 [Eumeta japonica]